MTDPLEKGRLFYMKKALSIIALLVTISGFVYFYKFNPEKKEKPFMTCMLKNTTGYDCPGCGGQRAFHYLLHLDFTKAAQLNLFIYLFAPLLLYIILLYTLKPFGIQLPDLNLSLRIVIIFLLLLLIFGILRNLPYYPFTLFKS